MLKSSVRTYETLVMRAEEWAQVGVKIDGTPYALKGACTVWSGGKDGVLMDE